MRFFNRLSILLLLFATPCFAQETLVQVDLRIGQQTLMNNLSVASTQQIDFNMTVPPSAAQVQFNLVTSNAAPNFVENIFYTQIAQSGGSIGGLQRNNLSCQFLQGPVPPNISNTFTGNLAGSNGVQTITCPYPPSGVIEFTIFPSGGTRTFTLTVTCSLSSTFSGPSGGNLVAGNSPVSGVIPILVDSFGDLFSVTGGSGGDVDGRLNTLGFLFTDQTGGSNGAAIIYPHLFNGTTWDRQIVCNNTTAFGPIVSTVTQVIPLVGGQKIRICSLDINPSTVTAGSTDIVTGTGANCGTGTATLTGAYTLPAAAVVDITPSTLSATSPLTAPVGTAVCVRSVTSTVNGFIVWEQH